jgi:hypothetical protein
MGRCPSVPCQLIAGHSLERAFPLHQHKRGIPVSSLQVCCGGCGGHRQELGFDSPSLTLRTGLADP